MRGSGRGEPPPRLGTEAGECNIIRNVIHIITSGSLIYHDFNTISTSRAVHSLGSCGSLIYHDFNTISTSRAVHSLGSCGSLIYHDFNTISTSRAVSSLGRCGSLIIFTDLSSILTTIASLPNHLACVTWRVCECSLTLQ